MDKHRKNERVLLLSFTYPTDEKIKNEEV